MPSLRPARPAGDELVTLHPHGDVRGDLTEVFRDEWVTERPVQWNVVRSAANALRGVHVHHRHADYLIPIAGTLLVGLCDLRRSSTGYLTSRLVELSGDAPAMIQIMPGVAHGFFTAHAATYMYGVTSYWDPEHDELRCRWDDPDLGLAWPVRNPLVSALDAAAPSLATLLESVRRTAKDW